MYSKEESLKLINAGSSNKIIEKDSCDTMSRYEQILCKKESFKLVNPEEKEIKKIESNKTKLESTQWMFDEVFALINGIYDPRNYGSVKVKLKR